MSMHRLVDLAPTRRQLQLLYHVSYNYELRSTFDQKRSKVCWNRLLETVEGATINFIVSGCKNPS